MADIHYSRIEDDRAIDSLDELTSVHQRVYAEPPYHNASKYGRHQFIQRTEDQARSPGFTLITARHEETLVGYTFGFTMSPGQWWSHADAPAPEIRDASKFAIIEWLVLPEFRRQGVGRQLYDRLLKGRSEAIATLAAVPEADAYGIYGRWGWTSVGTIKSQPPYAESLILPLRGTDPKAWPSSV